MMEPTKLAWLAGLIDGEGCLYARHVTKMANKPNCTHNRIDLRLEIHANSPNMIDTICAILDGLDVRYQRDKPRYQKLGTRPAILLRVQQKHSLLTLLEALLPYLVVKKPEAERSLQWLRPACAVSMYRLQEADLTLVADLQNLKLIA